MFLLLLLVSGAASALNSGHYRVVSYNGKYLTENTSNHTLVCSDLAEGNYAQVWYLDVNETSVSFKNVLTDRYIYWLNDGGQFYTDANTRNFTYGEDNGVYTFHITYEYIGLHCDANQNVVYYDISEAKSKWTLASATVDANALAAQKATTTIATTTDLLKVFTTTACTELKSGYSESDLTALPASVQELATKIKNNSWTVYDGWDKTEKTFRIADYKAYSSPSRWTSIIGLGYSFGRLTNPTGISVSAGDYLQVYVGAIPSGQAVQLDVAGDHQSSGTTYTLKEGMNVLLMASSGNCFVNYEVDNTTDGNAPYTAINSYTPVTVHIEGGNVNGYFDLTKGDDNSDWASLQTHLLKGSSVELKTDNLVFHMMTDLVKAACPEKMVELLGEWDKILNMEYSLMGLENFEGYWNNMLIATDMTDMDYMHASTYGTYYDVNTLSSIMSYAEMFAGGALWGPAHENGHLFQKYINMVGQTEVSNNLFSNVAVYNNGHLTSRASHISTTFENMAAGVFWNDRGIWECTHLYFQLYQFFHILGNKTDFYPELFKALRSDPLVHTANTFISATDDYLKFYKKCCSVSGYDLTEFFQAYGFFVIPSLTSYTLNSVTKDAYQVGDYGNYYLTVTQAEIDAAKLAVAEMNLPKANIIFIEDRIKAPDATYEGAAAGTKKTAFSNEYPIGGAGETGQYTDFGATCSEYKYNVTGGTVTMEGTGAVGFKVYDSTGKLRGLYNTYTFTLPDGIGDDYTIKAAAGDGTDAEATYDEGVAINPSDVTDVICVGVQITDESQLVSGRAYLLQHQGNGTNKPWIEDTGTYYNCPNSAGNCNAASVWYLYDNGDGTWRIKNSSTGKFWPMPTGNANLVGTDAANAGNWTLNFSNGIAAPTCNGYRLNRNTPYLVSWNSGSGTVTQMKIYEVTPDLSTAAINNVFVEKDISLSDEPAASLETNQWYVMFDRGANHGYLYENGENKLYNTATAPSGSAISNAKYLVRIVGWDNEYYLQTGLGNFFGNIQHGTNVSTTATTTEQITVKKINSTDGHFYLMSAAGVVLNANSLEAGDATVVGWGTTAPTTTGGNNDWAFYPVEFVDSWIPTISEVYTINNTNTNRGALTYEPAKSTKFVWSSGKSGATAFDASNVNHQWVLVPTGTSKQYYLYNVGAGKFAIPTGIAQSNQNSWIFSDNAVAVVLESVGTGEYKIKMATNPVSGTNAAYMAISNNYTGPIINWNDVGGNFTITKVDGDASAAANAAVAKLVKNQTALTGAVTADDGWYVISIKTTSNSTATASPGRYIYPGTTNQANYPLTFTGGVDVQPAISDATFFTRFVKNETDYNWQMTNGQYLINRSNVFPTASSEPVAVVPGYDNGCYIKSNGRFADPYVSNGNFFIGETASYRTTWSIYPIDLAAAGLVAWQVLCDNAPETAQITCSRSDVNGLTAVYKNGYFFLPTGVTPESTDFNLDGATNVTVNATAKTVTFAYNPDLAIVEDGVIVEQGWQTAGRDSEVMLLRVTAKPFKAATSTTLTVSLKDGSENNISALKLYEASTNSPEIYSTGDGAPTKTEVATASISGSTATFNIGNLTAGTHYYWIGATVSSTATLGAVLDAAVTGIAYQVEGQTAQNLDLTSVGDPADRGAMVFNAQSYPFLPRDNGSRVYRIPAMIVAEDGSIVVAADKRYQSHTDIGNGGHVIDIVVRRSTDGGKTWSAPVTIAKGEGSTASGGDDKRCGFGDPSLVKGKDGKLYCLFAAGNEGYFYGQKGMCMSVSTDNGVTWSSGEGNPPVDLYWSGAIKNVATAGAAGFGLYDYFVTSGRGLYIPEDDILMYLIPAQTMTSATEHTGDSQDYVFYSRDGGESWYFSEIPMVQGGDEAKIIQMNDGSLFGSIRKGGPRRFNTATYTKNDDGKTLSFNFGTQWENNQLYQSSQNNQDIIYYQRETKTGKKDYIFHSITTGNHTNLKLYYSTDQGSNWTEFLNVQTKGTRYVTMEKSGTEENPGSLYLFFEDQSLNGDGGGYTDYNHYPLNFLEITREQLVQYIPDLEKSSQEKEVKIVYGTSGEATYGSWNDLTWTSNAASGVEGLTMTLSDGKHDKFSNYNSRYNMAYHPAAANTNSTLTLTAPEGYVITGYSVQTGVYQASTYTLTPSDGTPVTPANLGSTYTPINVSDISATSTAITITTTDASKWLTFANFVVILYPAYHYSRNVTPERWGTVCVPGAVAAADISGAEIYRIAGKEMNGDTPQALKLERVENMEAGKPYLFLPSEDELSLTYYGNTIVSTPGSGNGLIGSFTGMIVAEGYYLLTNNTIVRCGTGCSIPANRAYIDMEQVPVYSGGAGVKSISIFDDPDGIETIDDEQSMMDDVYDLAGRKVSHRTLRKGIYITNGKKVLF